MTVSDGAGRVRIDRVETIGEWHGRLARTHLAYRRSDGHWQEMVRETYSRGNGCAVLPVDPERGTVLLIRQFRFAIHALDPDGMLIETIAGLLDGEAPEVAIVREAREEAGVELRDLERAFEMYPSPGVITEAITCFTARYAPADRTGHGGGLHAEGEDIEVVEMTLDAALRRIRDGGIRDAKTIMLLQHARLAGIA